MERDGVAMDSKEYLEYALKAKPNPKKNRRLTANNEIRESFKSLFQDRHCHTLVRPVAREEDLIGLSSNADPADVLRRGPSAIMPPAFSFVWRIPIRGTDRGDK